MKPGRNEPCSCGSGKKYKQCCLKAERQVHIEDFIYHRLLNAKTTLVTKLLQHAKEVFGEDSASMAWDYFAVDSPYDDFTDESPLSMMFVPWFLYNWTIEDEIEKTSETAPLFTTVAEDFLKTYDHKLSSDEKMILQAANRRPLSFYEVIGTEPGQSLLINDLLQRQVFKVLEKTASKILKPGEIILCATMLPVEDRVMLSSVAPYPLPPAYKHDVLMFREDILEDHKRKRITEKLLHEEEENILSYYFDYVDSLLNPKYKLTNSDGEPLVIHKLHYDLLCTPVETFELLKSLVGDEVKPEEFIEEDEAGAQEGPLFKFPWLRANDAKQGEDFMPNVLGHLAIKGNKLTVEVNSEERAERAKKEIKKRLGKKCKHVTTVIEDMESAFDDELDETDSMFTARDFEASKEIPPEFEKFREEMIQRHWKAWFDKPVPALGGQTPREASKTEEGRDLLKSLLLHYEYENEKARENFLKVDVNHLRQELGI